jgi:hypothetical protein
MERPGEISTSCQLLYGTGGGGASGWGSAEDLEPNEEEEEEKMNALILTIQAKLI